MGLGKLIAGAVVSAIAGTQIKNAERVSGSTGKHTKKSQGGGKKK